MNKSRNDAVISRKMNNMERRIEIKRAYEPASPDDGFRVYIDRLWPQGLSHETFHYDLWDKNIAPSTGLREWFHSSPGSLWDDLSDGIRLN